MTKGPELPDSSLASGLLCSPPSTFSCSMNQRAEELGEAEKPMETRVVLTPPFALEQGKWSAHGLPDLVQRLLSLFRGVRLGSDFMRFELPPQFNLPKSHLQSCGETVYCVARDVLGQCARGETSLERITAVVAWSISTVRPFAFGVSPFNPVLGETHHVSRGSLNVFLEQVSHHPPVTAFHATDSPAKVEIVWCFNIVAKFKGTSVDAVNRGQRRLNLLSHGESYEFNSPTLLIKSLPTPGTEWTGVVCIRCMESGLEAELRYHRSHSILGLGGNPRAVKGKVFRSDTKETLREIEGRWDGEVTVMDVASGKVSLLYDAKATISELEMPVLREPKALLETESAAVWAEVSAAVLRQDWDQARKAKRTVEEEQRRRRGERDRSGEIWEPKYFKVARNDGGGWECFPISSEVPPAPIVVPTEI